MNQILHHRISESTPNRKYNLKSMDFEPEWGSGTIGESSE